MTDRDGLFGVPGLNPEAPGDGYPGLSREKPFSVSEISREIRDLLETGFQRIWVEGEVGSLRAPPSGHLYLNLKDEQCQIRVVIFRGTAENLGFTPADGQRVLVRGRVSAYAGRSEYQVIADLVEERGQGELLRRFEELKRRLAAEGLFDSARKKSLPFLVERLGVVTSPDGAALRDIRSVLRRRFPGIRLTIYPTLVQGREAAPGIVKGIEELNRLGGFDALLVTRGGGSLEDLWAFNEETVARAVCASNIPVISAVGHEIDTTISDLAADLRAPTPSAAAEMISLHREETLARLDRQRQRLATALENRLRYCRQALDNVRRRYGFRRPQDLLQVMSQRVDDLAERLARTVGLRREKWRAALEALGRALSGLSPRAVLTRGYSITMLADGGVVKDAACLSPGQVLRTIFARGGAASRVTAVSPGGGKPGKAASPPADPGRAGQNDAQGKLF